MDVAGRVVIAAAGVVLIAAALVSAVQSTILPRGTLGRSTRLLLHGTRGAFLLALRRQSNYEVRDRRLAMLGPCAILVLLAAWLLAVIAGFILIFLAVTDLPAVKTLEVSGSSVFTLGTTAPQGVGPLIVSYLEAGIGLLILTLVITYLPSIYSAYSRRENGVAHLEVRAGLPPKATEMLIRFNAIGETQQRLSSVWQDSSMWFSEIEESQTTFPVLVFFRSQLPERSWILAAGAVLDGASFWAAAIERDKDPDVQLMIRAGYLCLRRIASVFNLTFDPDPSPEDPITISREEWDEAISEMESAGVPIKADRDEAWRAWKGWRVNYDTVLLDLARLIEAPLAPWVSDRSPLVVPGRASAWLRGLRPGQRAGERPRSPR